MAWQVLVLEAVAIAVIAAACWGVAFLCDWIDRHDTE